MKTSGARRHVARRSLEGEGRSNESASDGRVIEEEVVVVSVVHVEVSPTSLQSSALFDLPADEAHGLIVGSCGPAAGIACDDYREFRSDEHLETGATQGVDPVLRCGDSVHDRRNELEAL